MIRELENALDTLAERQRVVSRNLANINTPGYKRSDVDFFAQMKKTFAGTIVDPVAEEDTTAGDRLDGNNVSLEREMFALSQSELLFQATSRFTTGAFQRMRYAITEGRG